MDGSLVAPQMDYGVVSPEAQSTTGHAGILLPLLGQTRSIGLVEAARLIGVSSRTMRRYAAEGPCSVRFACGLGATGASAAGNWKLGGLSCRGTAVSSGRFRRRKGRWE
jgi:hypothetical protein